MEKGMIKEARQELVVKSNKFIREARYSLSETEQKFLIYLISNVGKDELETQEIQIRLRDYCEIAGIAAGGGVIGHLKDTIKNIADKSWWIKTDDNKEILFRWVDTALVQGERVTVKLSSSLKPYILQLQQDFTKYELVNVLTLHGKYSIRLYELLKSYLWRGNWCISLAELRMLINCDKYEGKYKEFNRSVLKKSVEEINKYTDLNVSYQAIKYGVSVKEIEFTIEEKIGYEKWLETIEHRKKRLGE